MLERYSVLHVDIALPDEFLCKMNCSLQKPTYVPLLFPSYGNNDNLWPLESPEVILIFTSLLRCSYISSADICITDISIDSISILMCGIFNQVPFGAVNSLYRTCYRSSLFIVSSYSRKIYIYLRNFLQHNQK